MGTKLCPAVGIGARGTMEKIGLVGFIAALVWDSTTAFKISRLPGAGLFHRILKNLWDSTCRNCTRERAQYSKTRFSERTWKATVSQGIEASSPVHIALWDASESTIGNIGNWKSK